MKYLISYDLITPGKNYPALIDAIQSYGSWAKISRSCWMLDTYRTAIQIRDDLAQSIDSNDVLFVCEIRTWAAQNISQDTASWLID